MSLLGEGAVAIWHDIAPEGRDAFYAWHGEEHMPERLGVPGFLRGRRYVAIRGDLEFFNLYETQDMGVVTGPEYLARLNNPTPWTLAAVKHFRKVSRSLCRVAASAGRAQGGLIATWRYDVADERIESHRKAMIERTLPALAARRLVAGAHFLIADEGASAVDTAERKARPERNRIPRWILLLEGWGDTEAFDGLCSEALSERVLGEIGAERADYGLYRLQATRGKTAAG